MNSGKFLIGIAGLVVGLTAGYFIPRGGEWIARQGSPPSNAPVATKSARAEAERIEVLKKRPAEKLLQSIPDSANDSERGEWLENRSTADLPALIAGLCAEIGPDGLAYPERSFLGEALKKWLAEDREGAIAWVTNLPAGASKRYFMKDMLSKLLQDDAARALALSEAFQMEDPKWKHAEFHDQHVARLIDKGWKSPGVSAEDMLDLYSQLSRGSGTSGSDLGRYPEDFDFRKFLEGIASRNEQDEKQPSGMPTDVLQGWAKVDPQAAAQWFLEKAEKGSGVPLQDWDDIAKAVATQNSPQAYHEWAADVIFQASAAQRTVIFQSMGDPDAIGIAGSLDDIGLRDQIFAKMARKNSGTAGKTDQTIDFLARISTPEARLQAIKDDDSQYEWWMKKYQPGPATWQMLGLTQEQVAAAIAGKD